MKLLRFLILLLATLEAGWIAFDGAHALATGRYLRPRIGSFRAGTGSWTQVASALGVPARTSKAKWALIGFGAGWLILIVAYARGAAAAWWGMLIAALAATWYSVLAVPISLLLALLLVAARRGS